MWIHFHCNIYVEYEFKNFEHYFSVFWWNVFLFWKKKKEEEKKRKYSNGAMA